MYTVSKATLGRLRKEYPIGSRVELVYMDDPYNKKLYPGSKGTVRSVDDMGTIHVRCTWSVWYGNIDPQVQRTEGNKGIKNPFNLMGKNRDEFFSILTDKQKEILKKYYDCVNETYFIIGRETFTTDSA